MRTRTTLFIFGITALTLTGCTGTASPAPVQPTTVEDRSSSAAESVCGASAAEAENTLTTAPTNQWELVGAIAVTAENSDSGPFVVKENGERYCFARTAYGALGAAVGYAALMSTSDGDLLSRLIPLAIAPGVGRDAALTSPGDLANPALIAPQVVAFAIDEYDADSALVDIVWRDAAQGDALVSTPTSLQWIEGDWKIVLNDRAQPPSPSAVIDDLEGYIPWSAN